MIFFIKLIIRLSIIDKLLINELCNSTEIYKEAIDKFIDFLNKNIKNHLLLDNAKFHHNKNVKDFIINSNNNFLYKVRYYSENNPIENFFNQMKHYLEEIEDSIKYIVNNIKVEHLENYFKHVFIRGNNFIKNYCPIFLN